MSTYPKSTNTAAKRDIRNDPIMTEQNSVIEGGIDVNIKEGARAEKIKSYRDEKIIYK